MGGWWGAQEIVRPVPCRYAGLAPGALSLTQNPRHRGALWVRFNAARLGQVGPGPQNMTHWSLGV